MSYPQYPPQGQPQQPQGYPPQTQPAYPPQPQQFPPQAQPAYPPQAQPAYPPQQQGYAPGYPPQGYGPPQQPQVPLAKGSIDDFYEQPAASGKSLSFNGKPYGTAYTGYVARTITSADIQQQTAMNTRLPLFHPDGKPKFVMIVPLSVTPSQEFPDGRASWYVKGTERAELERAMEAAGVPQTADGHMPPPEAGALVTITYTGDRPVPNMSPQKMKAVTYQRPANANGNGHTVQQAPQPQFQAPVQAQYPTEPPQQEIGQPQFAGPYAPPQQQQFQALPWPPVAGQPQVQAPVPPTQFATAQAPSTAGPSYPPQAQFQPPPDPATAYQQATGQPVPPPQPQFQAPVQAQYATEPPQQAPMAVPSDLTPEQAERLRQLTGG